MQLPTNHRFGVEIEMLVPVTVTREMLAQALHQEGVDTQVMGYNHLRMNVWKIVSDASIRAEAGTYGVELVSPPISGDVGFEQVMNAGRVLTRLGCKVNRSCGLHVHVDASNMSVDTMRRLAAIYADAEGVLDSLMPPSRRGSANMFCTSVAQANKSRLATARDAREIADVLVRGSRYAKINFAAFWRHRTVEFRHHSGTVDGAKILNWVKLCLRLTKFAETSTVTFATGEAMPATVRAGTKRALLVELLMRPDGATRNELLAATSSRTLSLGALSRAAGVSIRRGRRVNGGYTRYYASSMTRAAATNVATDGLMNFDTFAQRLAFDTDELTFWRARRDFLNNALATHNP